MGAYADYKDEIESILRANEYSWTLKKAFASISFDESEGHSAAGLITQLDDAGYLLFGTAIRWYLLC